jgi:hypothetical protein
LNVKKLDEITEECDSGGGTQFVDFETSKGVFQLTVYNRHNGYYGHDILIESKQTGKVEMCL